MVADYPPMQRLLSPRWEGAEQQQQKKEEGEEE